MNSDAHFFLLVVEQTGVFKFELLRPAERWAELNGLGEYSLAELAGEMG